MNIKILNILYYNFVSILLSELIFSYNIAGLQNAQRFTGYTVYYNVFN